MVNRLFISIILIMGVSLSNFSQELSPQAQEILDTDRAFSDMALAQGMEQAFLANIAEDVLIYRDGPGIIYGRAALEEHFASNPPPDMEFSWQPEGARVAESGELGYSWGEYRIRTQGSDNEQKGKYLSVWRLTEGQWKLVADAGSDIK